MNTVALDSETKNVSRAAGVVGFFTLLSRILGLLRDMVLAFFFGTGMVADAFVVAFRIPNLLRRLFAEGSLTIAFIPVFTEYLTKRGRQEAFELARVVLAVLSLILTIVTVAGILLSPWIVRLQAFGFGGGGPKYELTVLLTRITFPYILLISLVAFFMGVLNSLRRFAAPAAAPIFLNVGIIAGAYVISPHCGEPVVGVAVGVLLGGLLQVILQIPWILKEGMRLLPRWQPDHPALKRIGLLMLPAVFGSAVYQLNTYVGTLLASFLPEGSVSWLYYADRLVQFPLGVFAIAISTAALPSFSVQAAENDLIRFSETLNHALRLVVFIVLPSTAGLIILGKPMIGVLLERGAFGPVSTEGTYWALVFYSAGLWAFSGIRVVVSAFYAYQDTKTPVKIAVVALVANLIFSLSLMGPLKHGGIALSLSMASTLQFVLLMCFLRRKLGVGGLGGVLRSLVKPGISSVVMTMGLLYLKTRWLVPTTGAAKWDALGNLGELVASGVIMYFGTARILGCSELSAIWEMARPLLWMPRKSQRRGKAATRRGL